MRQVDARQAAREAVWDLLERHADQMRATPLKTLFADDATRAGTFTLSACGLTVDHAKQRLTPETLALFEALAAAVDLTGQLGDMRAGAPVNITENRAAMHVALRGAGGDGDARAQVSKTRGELRAFAMDVAAGRRAGAGGPFNAIVHIGIGGSDLGPRLIIDALKTFRRPGMTVRFAANVDGAEIVDALEGLDPARTMVAVVSKTFTTQETMANADAARMWLTEAVGAEAARKQVVAISAAPESARTWGAGEVFPFWDWVGGRYSLWSAVGLTTEIALADGAFDALLAGASAMDTHVFDTALGDNLAFRAACVQCFNRLLGATSYATIPYARRLQLLPSFLQQLEMESNGKSVDADGAPLARLAAAVTWGDAGTNAQHSFFQLLHQGKDVVPVDFIVLADDAEGPPAHRTMLLSNALAQAQALLEGKTADAAMAEMVARGENGERAAFLSTHRAFPGDRPSSLTALDRLDPATLGALLSFYEHRTVIQAWLAGINPFDQWGVELGKQMAAKLLPALKGEAASEMDASTTAWVERLRR